MQGDILPFGLRRNPVWRDSSNVKRERAVGDGYGIEGMSSDSGILLGIILNFCHFLSDLMGFYLFDSSEYLVHHLGDDGVAVGFEGFGAPLSERKGKAVHIKGKPIISSVYRGLSREPRPGLTPHPSKAPRYSIIFKTAGSVFAGCLPSLMSL